MTRQALVVDDSRATRALLARLLKVHGFEVHQAGDGMEGMAQLAAVEAIELALVDWNMPTMDGLAFIKAVRATPEYERLALVMVTSENDPAHIARALMAGADEYAMKPLTAEALADKLELVGLLESA